MTDQRAEMSQQAKTVSFTEEETVFTCGFSERARATVIPSSGGPHKKILIKVGVRNSDSRS